jgi:hypothetical protein
MHIRRDFNNRETPAVINLLFLEGKLPNEIYAILTDILGDLSSSYANVKNMAAHFKCGDFSMYNLPRPGRSNKLTTRDLLISFTI